MGREGGRTDGWGCDTIQMLFFQSELVETETIFWSLKGKNNNNKNFNYLEIFLLRKAPLLINNGVVKQMECYHINIVNTNKYLHSILQDTRH